MLVNKNLTLLWSALLLAALVELLTAGCSHTSPNAATSASITDASYVGNQACKPCHESEFTSHHGSRHDTTMHLANASSLGELLPPTGVVPLAGYSFERNGDTLSVTRSAVGSDAPETQKLDFALGSGKLGMTYISLLKDDSLLETHMSYFRPYKMWAVTPGQEMRVVGDSVFGRTDPGEQARLCLGCHATALPEKGKGIGPELKFFGVGCESCHGSGRAHIEAVNAGRMNDLHMEDLGKLSPSKLNDLCGRCHRTAKNVNLDTIEVTLTHRFQPYALLRSRCRTGSDEPLSCLYCHNPHADASKDAKQYEAVCLSCHKTAASIGNKSGSIATGDARVDVREGKVCPVNASNGCIRCHMRPRIGFVDTAVPAKMADHLINIPGRKSYQVKSRPNQ